jgi:hypothetical protein
MAKPPQRPDLSRPWVRTYLLVFALAFIVYIILDIVHGGPPWSGHPW